MNVQSPVTHQRLDNTEVLIIGDSMVKSIKTRKLSKTRRIRCKTIPGAKIESASDTVLSHTCQFSPQEIILRLGTNIIMHDETDEIIAKISSLADQSTKMSHCLLSKIVCILGLCKLEPTARTYPFQYRLFQILP